MAWSDPTTGSALFDTNDIPTEGNFDTYIFDNLLSLMHPLEAPTTGDLDVVSSVAETTLYSVTVPANSLGTNGCVLMDLAGDFLHNNVGVDTITVRVKFGGVTLLDAATDWNSGVGAARKPWRWEIRVGNEGATNAQLVWLHSVAMFPSATSPTAGIGYLAVGDPRAHGIVQNTAAIDTTVDQTLLVSVQWSASSVNNSWRRRWARTLIGRN